MQQMNIQYEPIWSLSFYIDFWSNKFKIEFIHLFDFIFPPNTS